MRKQMKRMFSGMLALAITVSSVSFHALASDFEAEPESITTIASDVYPAGAGEEASDYDEAAEEILQGASDDTADAAAGQSELELTVEEVVELPSEETGGPQADTEMETEMEAAAPETEITDAELAGAELFAEEPGTEDGAGEFSETDLTEEQQETAAGEIALAAGENEEESALKLTNLQLGTSRTISTSTQVAFDREFDGDLKEYTATAYKKANRSLYIKAAVSGAAQLEAIYIPYGAEQETSISLSSGSRTGTELPNLLKNGSNTLTVRITDEDGKRKEYTVTVNQIPALSGLNIYTSQQVILALSPKLSSAVNEYEIIVPASEQYLLAGAVGASFDSETQQIFVNGTVSDPEVENGIVEVPVPKADTFDIEVKVTDSDGGASTENTYILHAVKSYTVRFILNPDYAQFTVKDADGAVVAPVNDSYTLVAGKQYTYTAEASGYESVIDAPVTVFASQLSEIPVNLLRSSVYSEVDNVINLIAAIGGVTLNGESKAKIDAAREAYNALPEEDKLLVDNYGVLTEAEHYYNQLLAKEEEAPTDSTLNWSQFLGNEDLKGISDAKTPQTGEDLVEKWKIQAATGNTMFQHVSAPAYYNGYIYVTMDDKILKLDPESGETLAENTAAGCMCLLPQVTCADGKVFAMAQNDDKYYVIKVYDADTLELLYQTVPLSDVASNQVETPIMYHEGRFYLASYSNKGAYYSFIATDDKLDYDISPEWSVTMLNASTASGQATQGFLWSGAEFVGDYTYFGDHDGVLYAVDKRTGQIVDTMRFEGYMFESTGNYYEKNQRLYVSMASSAGLGGAVLSVKLNSDGSFDRDSMKWFKSDKTGTGIKSSPVIYNDRMYLCGGGGHSGSSEPFRVIDVNTMTEIYRIDDIASKGTPVLSTAYATEENNYKVYLYVVPYAPEGPVSSRVSNMYIIQDSVGQTEPIYEKVENIGVGQYCSQSMTIGANGLIYYYNDSNYLYAYGLDDLAKRVITGEDVERQIQRQPEVDEYKYYNNTEIKRIKERYDALSDEEKAKVVSIQKLLDILEISDMDVAVRINNGIAAIPEEDSVTLNDRDMIQNLVQIYQSMSDEDKARIENREKLEAAWNKIQELEKKEVVDAIIADIAKLPQESEICSTDQAAIYSILTRTEALDDDAAAMITNLSRLQAAKARVDAVVAQREALDKLITDTLDGITITLENRGLIDAVDNASKGLVKQDIFSLESYQYYVSPAKVELINALIAENGLKAGLEINSENADRVQGVLNEIRALYDGIIEDDLKYLVGYQDAMALQARIDAYKAGTGTKPAEHVHTYTKWTSVQQATVFKAETQERSCISCGKKESRTVGDPLTPTISVNASKIPLKVKQSTKKVKVTGLADGDSVVSWKSSNTKIFKVTKKGKLTAGKKTGKATLTITLASGLKKKIPVTVQKGTVKTKKIKGLDKKITLKKGKKKSLKPILNPITSQQKLTYSSSNKKVAAVTAKGVVKAKKAGTAKITVKSGKKKVTVTVKVTK